MSRKHRRNHFDGDLERAVARLRELADRACGCLDAEKLNLLSFHIAAYLDVDLDQREETDRMRKELRSERQGIDRAWGHLKTELELD